MEREQTPIVHDLTAEMNVRNFILGNTEVQMFLPQYHQVMARQMTERYSINYPNANKAKMYKHFLVMLEGMTEGIVHPIGGEAA